MEADPVHPRFGQALRQFRIAAGLSQEALAERSGVSARGISDLERGERKVPRLETVRLLAEALNLDERHRQELVALSRSDAGGDEAMPRPKVSVGGDVAATDMPRAQHNLPRQPTAFFGRERDLEEVAALLRRNETRLVTLTGPGGAGKTRLALQVGAEMLPEFADGVVFVPLAPLFSSESVIPAIADALSVRERGTTPLQTTLTAYLRDMRVLLLLDNFEHVLDTSIAVNDLLMNCANLKVIVTSRTALHLQSEHIFSVDPLALPEPGRNLVVEDIPQFGALALFVDRARMAMPGLAIDDSSVSAIVEICRRLDGLPLAIELAAARIRFLSTQDLLERLDRRLAILTGGANDLPLRHQTLRDTIAWSYRLLSAEDARLFRRLSVFAGGWTLRAAEAIAGIERDRCDLVSTLDRLSVLVDSNFARRVRFVSGSTRYEMLETIREFGLERLAAHGESDEANESHARYFLAFVEEQSVDRTGINAALQGKHIEVEIENVRSALRWSLDRPDAVLALSLCAAMREFWGVRGYFSEGRAWIDAALAASGGAPAATRVAALDAGSWLACHQGELDTADRMALEGLAISYEHHDQVGIARALHSRGLVAQLRNDHVCARELYEECIVVKRSIDGFDITRTLGNLAQVEFHLGDIDSAVALLEECMSRDRAVGDVLYLGLHMTDLALILLVSDRDEGATEYFRSALTIHRDVVHVRMVTVTIEGLAALAGKRGQPEQAAQLYGATQAMREHADYPMHDPEQWRYPHYVALTRSQISDETFNAHWNAGRLLSMDDAIERALALSFD